MKKIIFLITILYSVSVIAQQPSSYKYTIPQQLNDGIQTATFKDVGIDEKIIRAMTDSIINGNYPNIHSVLILRNNKLVYEQYWPGNDAVRGKGFVGYVDHHRDSLHDLRSATKSVIASLILVAHAQGKIKSLNQRVFDFFPEYSRYDTGMKRNITVQHLLNMSAGLEWNENISYMDPSNSETRMDTSRQPVEFVLSRDLIDTPGKKFNYSGGSTQVLAAIVEKTTGLPADRFAEKYLFQPLGIKEYNWVKRSDGIPIAASGLRLRSRDLAKFGLLFLNNGKWNGKQIIPSHLVAQTLKSQIYLPYADSIMRFVGYSNQFWIFKVNIKGELVDYVQGQGNGGQIIQLDRRNNLVLVVTAGNYNERNIRKNSFNIYPDFVYPAVIRQDKSINKKK
jgi:CubicO group peptidase (beta-lactamase class C family)